MLFKVEGIIIRSFDYGEGNKIIVIYSATHGKTSLMAKGAKKLRSKHASACQLFTYAEFSFFKGSGMGTLNHAETIRSFHSVRSDLIKTAYAAYIVELVDRLLEDRDASSYLFSQLLASLVAIEDGKDAPIITHIFELIMLQAAGYAPVLNECVSCGRGEELESFNVQAGGLLCKRCTTGSSENISISPRSIRLMKLFLSLHIDRLGSIDVSEETRSQLKQVLRSFMTSHIPVQLKARHFLDQMEKYDF